MKVLIIGLGSMGQRRIRLLRQIQPECSVEGVELNVVRGNEIARKTNISVHASIAAANVKEFDCVIVCTSPLTHCSILKELLPYNIPIFTELNLVRDGYETFEKAEESLFLSSTLLYRKDIEYIIAKVNRKPVNYIYHVGQYLPDWHPWECYKDYFVGDKRTNGCREIMAIDFPWLVACFGKIVDMSVMNSKMTELDINYSDNYLLMFEHETGAKGTVSVDVVSRKARRNLEIFSEQLHLFWDGAPNSLSEFDINTKKMINVSVYDNVEQNIKYSDNIIEDAYRDELKAFIKMVEHQDRSDVKYSFKKDKEILQLIDEIEN